MVISHYDAGLAVYIAFIGFERASSVTPVETKVMALAKFSAWNAFLQPLSAEKDAADTDFENISMRVSLGVFAQWPPSS